ncbi:hypothetical protein NC652_039607 [Populus alba x Populus x berolinensis]|nr:hypothetical protein NC652_039607 [Populus alba x Populus x berolinensis]
MLVLQYKLFKMLLNESITSMFTRMITITNSLDLNGSLMNHEITMEKQEQGEKPKKSLEFKTIHHINDGNKEDSNNELLRCFECNKARHIKVDLSTSS